MSQEPKIAASLGYRRPVDIPEDWIRETWAAQLTSADVIEASIVLYVVTDGHDLSKVEMAYLPPNGAELAYEVLRRVGEERLDQANGLHRLAIFQRVRDAPLGGLAAMLRHELRHAEQFHAFGPGLFELNGHLRAALGVGTRAAEREQYEVVPLEYDANRVAAAYAHANHGDELEGSSHSRGWWMSSDLVDKVGGEPALNKRREFREAKSR